MKTCSKCGETKPLEMFAKRKGASDGHRGECKACKNKRSLTAEQRAVKNARLREYKRANPEILAEQRKAYRDRNKEKIKQSSIEYRLKNAERIRERQRQRYLKNKEKIQQYFNGRKEEKREYDRAYRMLNAANHAKKTAEWKRQNPDKLRAYRANRRARIVGGKITEAQVQELLEAQRYLCRYCGKDLRAHGYHLDHRMPLVLGGTNARENLQMLCPSCNVRKHAKHPEVFERMINFVPA